MNFKRNKLNLIKFDRAHCKTLLDNNKIDEAKLYIRYFFFNYETKIFFFNGIEFILYSREEALKLIPDDLKVTYMLPNAETKKFDKVEFQLKQYLKSVEFMNDEFKPTIDFTTDELYIKRMKRIRGFEYAENLLNMAKPFNHDTIRGINFKVTKDIKAKTDLIYNHIKVVLCNENEEIYEYVLNFFACSLFGRKLRKALYIQSKERTGKGIIMNDVLKAILGDRMHKTNSVESILKYSKPFEGCCLINFDELPHSDNYKGVQDALKGLITEQIFICRDMFSTGYEQANTFNIMITTNNDAVSLTQNNKSRYFCLDVNESKIGDTKYFEALAEAIKSKDVLENFYNDMKIRFDKLTIDKWNEDNMPQTQTGKLKIIEALPRLYKFIKEEFIFKDIDINMRTDKFLTEYKLITKDNTTPQKIGRMLKDIGIVSIKNSKNDGYNYKKTAKELLAIFDAKSWIDSEVDLINKSMMFSDNTEFEPNMFIKENDKAEYIRAEEYKQQIDSLNAINENHADKLETLHEEFNNAMEYIKQLENLINEKKPTKKQKQKNDSVENVIDLLN